jgi:hypothetical protein
VSFDDWHFEDPWDGRDEDSPNSRSWSGKSKWATSQPTNVGTFNKQAQIVKETDKAMCITGIATDSETGSRYFFEGAWFPKSQINWPNVKSWFWNQKIEEGTEL